MMSVALKTEPTQNIFNMSYAEGEILDQYVFLVYASPICHKLILY